MNHFTGTYIDLMKAFGVIIILGVAAYAVKQILLKAEYRIEKVDVRIEE